MLLLLVLGLWLGGHPTSLPEPVRDVFVDQQVADVDEALADIEHDYYRKPRSSKLTDDAINGAVLGLDDRFSNYFDPKEYAAFLESTAGEFSGVGLDVLQDPAGLKIQRAIPGSPAARAGLRAGDLIVAVNGTSIAGKASQVSTALIKGRPGTSVTLTVSRDGRRRVQEVRRARIDVPVVTSSVTTVGGVKYGVDRLASFTSGAHGELRQSIDRQLKAGAKGIVLDLRGNGGGLLDEAVLVSSIFIPEGTIVSTDGRTRDRQVYRATGGAISTKIPVVVLVDKGTASASEIVSAALKERGRAKIVGAPTFGKGVFQEVKELSSGGALDITVGEYFTPSGRNLGGGGVRQGKGVTPDIAARDLPTTSADEALQAALRRLQTQRDADSVSPPPARRPARRTAVGVLEKRGRSSSPRHCSNAAPGSPWTVGATPARGISCSSGWPDRAAAGARSPGASAGPTTPAT